jgi:predicted phage tail protein
VQRQIDDIQTDDGTDSGSGYPPILPIPMITAEDITALGTYESIILSWDVAYDYWIAYYEILRASTNTVGDAVVIGSTISKVYADQVGPGLTFYYWVRIVQRTEAGGNVGVLPVDGKQGSTFDDPTHLLELLIGRITESQLYQDLADRIDLIDGTGDGSVDARIVAASAAEAAARAQAILEEALARQALTTRSYSPFRPWTPRMMPSPGRSVYSIQR